MAEPDYNATIQRILDILQANTALKRLVRHWRFGDLPKAANADAFPACYVTTATTPEARREILGPATTQGKSPSQTIETEYWVVFLADGATPELAQKAVYTLRDRAVTELRANVQLRLTDGTHPLCSTSRITSIRRLTTNVGKTLEGITIRILAINHVAAS